MNPVEFALRHPITTIMAVVAIVCGGGLAVERMRMDIFPPFDLPYIYVIQNYNGMSPAQMEGLIVNQYELNFQYVDGLKNVESKCIQQIALMKLSFYPGTDMAAAMAAVVGQANRATAFMPEGVLPPQIMRMDAGSFPVGYLVMSSKTESLGKIADLAEERIRPLLQSNVPGTVGTAPFGSNIRSIVISVDPDRMRAYNLAPDDIVRALVTGNAITPAGNLYVKDQMPMVPSNTLLPDAKDFGSIPLRLGRNVYLRDVGTIADATDINYGYAMVNGHRSVYIPVVKKSTSSTLTVVDEIHKSLPMLKEKLPEGVDLKYEFDQSPVVKDAIKSVATEGAIGAVLTGLMILLFLHDWRSMLVVVFNIPLALCGSLVALWISGETINIMTLGGLALAIGMLVDEATVSIENIHVQMGRTRSLARAVERGSLETAVPRLLAMLCILSVFIPSFIMAEPVRSLFVPLSLAVGFAMVTSYVLSSTLVPVLSVWLLKHHGHMEQPEGQQPHGEGQQSQPEHQQRGIFERVHDRFQKIVAWIVDWRWVVVPSYFALCAAVLAFAYLELGTELFPVLDSGTFVLRYRMPPGTNYEITRQAWVQCLKVIEDEVGADNVLISMGFAGQQAPDYAMNNMLLFMRGPDDGQLRVQLRPGIVKEAELEERLRKELPKRLIPWLTEVIRGEGVAADEARKRAEKMVFGFEPGDVISQVMSFGARTPIEVEVASIDVAKDRQYAQRLKERLDKIGSLRDVEVDQVLDYPTVAVHIDREKAGLSGVTASEVGKSVLVATSSSRMVQRNYWQDPKTGVSYQVQVQVPQQRMNSPQQAGTIPLLQSGNSTNLMVRDVASISEHVMPGEFDRTSMQRYLSLSANVVGEDLGRARDQIDQAIKEVGKPPRGITVSSKGQIAPMEEMFRSLAIGLVAAVLVIFIMLTAYFENWRSALVSLGAVPGVLSGVAIILWLTGTTLNIESFMGTIMAIGVSVSNSVMLVTFTARDWEQGKSAQEAAVQGASERLRPILMTACAMVVGMIPMSLALESGSQMEAPLGRAVIGGLTVSTFATLLMIPAIYSIVVGKRRFESPSLHPDDPASKHADQDSETVKQAKKNNGESGEDQGAHARHDERPGSGDKGSAPD